MEAEEQVTTALTSRVVRLTRTDHVTTPMMFLTRVQLFKGLTMSFNKAILRQYAQLAAPDTLPRSIYFEHTECTVTIFDAYPKATFHFLLLPRVGASPLSASNLTSLRTLLRSPNVGMDEAGKLLRNMKQDADKVKDMIEEEMVKLYGFKWPVHMGFHAVQSME